MVIDLRELKRKGKTEESFYFEYQTERELSTLPDVIVDMPIKVNGTVSLTGEHSAYVECEIVFSLTGSCNRCLQHTTKIFTVNLAEESDDESQVLSVIGDRIVLDGAVEDTVIINLPLIFLCDDDCKGICAGCGTNLNNKQCKCNNE